MISNLLISFELSAPIMGILFILFLIIALVGYSKLKKLFSKPKKDKLNYSQTTYSSETYSIKPGTVEDISLAHTIPRREIEYSRDEVIKLQMQLKNKEEQLLKLIQEKEEMEKEIKELRRRLQEIYEKVSNAPPEIKAFIEGKEFEPFNTKLLMTKVLRMQEEWEKTAATHAVYPFKPLFVKIKEIANLQDAYMIMGRPYYSAEQVISFFEKILTEMKKNRYLWDALEWLKKKYG